MSALLDEAASLVERCARLLGGGRSTRRLVVGPSATWFELDDGRRVDLSTRRALRLMLAVMVHRRRRAPGRGVSLDELLAAGWPGEKVQPAAGASRVYTAIRTLRREGLAGVLVRHDDGYLLIPEVVVDAHR